MSSNTEADTEFPSSPPEEKVEGASTEQPPDPSTETPSVVGQPDGKKDLGESVSGDSIFSVNFAETQPVPLASNPPGTSTLTPDEVAATTSSMTGSTDSYIMVDTSPVSPQTHSEPTSKPDPPPPPQEWLDVLGNGSLKKLTLEAGEGQQPTRGHRVRLELTGRLHGMEGEVVEREVDLEVEVGDAEVVQGIDLTLPLMAQGELAWLYMEARFGYGESGNGAEIPERAELYYLVRVKEVRSRYDYANLTEEKLVELVERKRVRGNNLYRMNQLSQAMTAYQAAIRSLELHPYYSTPDGRSIGCRILTNLAITQYKYDHKTESLASCDKALSLQPNDTKALFRKSVLLTEQHEYDESLLCLEAALRASPEDRLFAQEARRVRELREQSNRRQRNVYRRMIQGDTRGKEEGRGEQGRSKRTVVGIILASSVVAVAALCVGLFMLKKS